MPVSAPRDSTIAVVGDGFGSLIVYATAVYLGFRPQEITIYGPSDNPVKTYQQFAFNLGQTVLRSESESHFLPADWPTFAELEAWSRRSLSPLIRSARRQYNPGVPDILVMANVVARRLGWNDNRYDTKVGWLQRADSNGDTPHFVLFDEDAQFIGRAKHVMLACGHGPLSYPPVLAKARQDPALADRIVQAYAPKTVRPQRPLHRDRLGDRLGQRVGERDRRRREVHLARPQPDPRRAGPEHSALLLRGARDRRFPGARLRPADRVPRPHPQGHVAAPPRLGLEDRHRAAKEGRFEQIIGEIDEIEPGPLGLRVHIMSKHGEDPGWLDVTGVVTGTGFNKSALSVPLLRRLIEFYKVPIEGGRMKLQSNCGLPGLDRPDSRCAAMGIHANAVITHGDTIAGLKYIGRRFVADCFEAEKPKPRRFPSRLAMQLGLFERDGPR